MKKMLFPVIFFIAFAECKAQNEKKIEVSKFVTILDTFDMNALINLIHDLGYALDSNQQVNGFRVYSGRENKVFGNVLSCSFSSENKVDHISFSTRNINTYKNIKKQIEELNFKSSGLQKSRLPPVLESENFMREKILISVASRKKENDKIQYDFSFLHWP
jgi:hypothetical protein